MRVRIGVYLFLGFRECELEEPRWLREVKRVEFLSDGEGVRIVRLRDFLSGGS